MGCISERIHYENVQDGIVLACSEKSGVEIKEQDGFVYKDLSRCGFLLPYEDYRLSAVERAQDLAKRLSISEIAGLMLYSAHQMVPGGSKEPFVGHYNGKIYHDCDKTKIYAYALSDEQKDFLKNEKGRHVLATQYESTEVAAKWNNELQKYAESLPWGIPVNTSSDPRNGAYDDGAEYRSGGSTISKWPEGIGLAATFDPEIARGFARVASKEYRALGITTALGPQIDLATEPRWMRFVDTFGEHLQLNLDITKAYCDGLQTTERVSGGWGKDSVNGMAKHWPGGGSCEAGRDAHYAYGKYAVYPGNNFDTMTRPFTEGAFKLNGPTMRVAAVMPYYTVAWNHCKDEDKAEGRLQPGNSYNEYIVKDLLREKHNYDGVVCADWGITADPAKTMNEFGSRCYGRESLTVAERHLNIIMNGVDQFGGNNDAEPVIEAYEIGSQKYGKDVMRARYEQSAVRLLVNVFHCGLFENLYLNPEQSCRIVGCDEYVKEGFRAQQKSIVMLKNESPKSNIFVEGTKIKTLPLRKGSRIYIPGRHIIAHRNFMRFMEPDKDVDPVSKEQVEPYFKLVDSPDEAEAAIVFMESPISDGYSPEDMNADGNGYLPINLQYRPYKAVSARKTSIAGGDTRETFTNRSYAWKSNITYNESDLDNVIKIRDVMGNKPVVVCMTMNNPCVMSEFEELADAIVVDFRVSKEAVLSVICGECEPSGLLPIQIPADMVTVEEQCEDVGLDMKPYTDSAGNVYDFAFGLNWGGVINDERTTRYSKDNKQ